jgi:predicted ATPase/DNA-binding winged helix-turn-helix (wHTH) protein
MESEQNFLFPPFRLDSKNGQLWRDQQALPLKPKTFAVLEHLMAHAGQLVTKEDLLDALWADVHVGDAVLKTCIREIRQALEDTPQTPRFIETVHRRGYRFIAPVAASAAPVLSSKLQVPSSATQRSALSTQHSILVGREAELAQLHRWLEKALHGARQIVFVSGEAGIGKSAVVNAFLGQLALRDDLWVAQGQCLEQYSAGEAYLPVLTAFGQLCRELEGERVKEILGRYAPTWLAQLPTLLSTAELDALQHRVVGATQERMLREMAEAIEELTLDRGVILWIDDLQWSDYSTLDLRTALARRARPARLLVLGVYRPVDVIVQDHPLKVVKQDLQVHGQCEELALELLAETAVQEYFTVRFAHHAELSAPLQDLARLIHRRTQGNPLFVVSVADELVRQEMIVERQGQWEVAQKMEEIGVPAGIRQFIEQQVEQLGADLQRVLEAASVAGMEFSAAAVAAGGEAEVEEVETKCEALVRRRQCFQTDGPGEWPDGTVAARYRFIHALYQQVVYERMPAGRCVSLHRRIGERLEAAHGGRATEIAAALAVHFERGRDYPRAVQYRWQAGENAMKRHAHQEAIVHFTQGLEVLTALPDTAERAQQELLFELTLGNSLIATKGWAAPEVEKTYARARELCKQIGETPQLFPALAGLYRFYLVRGQYQTGRGLAEQLLQLAQSIQDPTLLMAAHGALGDVLCFLGELVAAREHLEQCIARYDFQQHRFFASVYGDDPGILSLSFAAWALWLCGYPDQALVRSHEALTLAQELAHPHVLTTIRGLAAQLHRFRREGQAVQEHAEAALTLAIQQGAVLWEMFGAILRGWALTEQGQVEEGIAHLRQGLAAHRGTGTEAEQPHRLAMLVEAYRKAGQTEEGLALLDEALAEVDKNGERFYEAELYRLQGELLLTQEIKSQKAKGKSQKLLTPGPQSEAEACFHKAIDIARRQRAKSWELRAVMSLVRLWRQQGKKEEARQMLAEIYGWFTEGFGTADLQEAKALLEALNRRGQSSPQTTAV